MNLNGIEGWTKVLMDEESGGEGEGAPAAGGSLIGDAGSEGENSEAEGNEGQSEGGEGGDNAAAGTEGDAGEGSSGDDDKAGEGKEGEGDEEKSGAPESYEEFKVPDGFKADEGAMETFQEFAKSSNMTQEAAQGALDYYTKEVGKLFAAQEEAWAGVRKGWVESSQTDKEFGGKEFKQNMSFVAKATNAFGTPELREALNSSGMGDHPEMIRFFYRVGKLAGEGDFLTGQGESSGDVDPASVLYPSMN